MIYIYINIHAPDCPHGFTAARPVVRDLSGSSGWIFSAGGTPEVGAEGSLVVIWPGKMVI